MITISHRGNIEGSVPSEENKPEYIRQALSAGFDVEADLWVVGGECFLGHDKPQYAIPYKFLFTKGLWLHCKNLAAIYTLLDTNIPVWFFHQTDDFALTSNGYIWTYPGKKLTQRSIAVQLDGNILGKENVYGVCTDYPFKLKSL